MEFDSEEAFLQFEEDRYQQGEARARRFEKKARMTVPETQLALEESIQNGIEADGNETRVQMQNMEEGLYRRLDELQTSLAHKVENPRDIVELVGELSKEKVGILMEMLKKAKLKQCGRTKVEKNKI